MSALTTSPAIGLDPELAAFFLGRLQGIVVQQVTARTPQERTALAQVAWDVIVQPRDATLAARCGERRAGTTISFFASGMSCGGTIALTRQGVGYQIRVNWLTGGVDIVPLSAL